MRCAAVQGFELIRFLELEDEQVPIIDPPDRLELSPEVDDPGADGLVIDPLDRLHVGQVEMQHPLLQGRHQRRRWSPGSRSS